VTHGYYDLRLLPRRLRIATIWLAPSYSIIYCLVTKAYLRYRFASSGLDSNPQPADHESDAYMSRLPSHTIHGSYVLAQVSIHMSQFSIVQRRKGFLSS